MKNHYEILGIAPSATEDDIKAAYRKLAARYHPDRNIGKSDADHKFKEAKEAYETLSDPVKRREYDESRNQEILTDPTATAAEMWRTFINQLTKETP